MLLWCPKCTLQSSSLCQEPSWGGYEAKQPAARTAIYRRYDTPTINSWAVQTTRLLPSNPIYVKTDNRDCCLSRHSGAPRAQLRAPTRVWVCQEPSRGGYEAKQPAARIAIHRRYDTPTINSWAVQTTRLRLLSCAETSDPNAMPVPEQQRRRVELPLKQPGMAVRVEPNQLVAFNGTRVVVWTSRHFECPIPMMEPESVTYGVMLCVCHQHFGIARHESLLYM